MEDSSPYNPAAPENLGLSVADALLKKVSHPLGQIASFVGAGIYAIYYSGGFPAYAAISKRHRDRGPETPIYVGKAVPAGGRKGNKEPGAYRGTALFRRLSEHADSIRAASSTLNIADFSCQFLVVHEVWIPLAESLLIARFSPVWNTLIDGFGNHDPGSGRHAGKRPRWDVLHPGRSWAAKCQPRSETAVQLATEIEAYLRAAPSGLSDAPDVEYDGTNSGT
jgi:hypothetical protein